MKQTLVLALDRTGCLQTARWSDVNPSLWRQTVNRGTPDIHPDEIVRAQNDEGFREIRVSGGTVVCTGQAAPNDHPHVSLALRKGVLAICPYCGTRFRRASAPRLSVVGK
jgi:uncharacterized Zn-finger protein